jgi:hypothetical protein
MVLHAPASRVLRYRQREQPSGAARRIVAVSIATFSGGRREARFVTNVPAALNAAGIRRLRYRRRGTSRSTAITLAVIVPPWRGVVVEVMVRIRTPSPCRQSPLDPRNSHSGIGSHGLQTQFSKRRIGHVEPRSALALSLQFAPACKIRNASIKCRVRPGKEAQCPAPPLRFVRRHALVNSADLADERRAMENSCICQIGINLRGRIHATCLSQPGAGGNASRNFNAHKTTTSGTDRATLPAAVHRSGRDQCVPDDFSHRSSMGSAACIDQGPASRTSQTISCEAFSQYQNIRRRGSLDNRKLRAPALTRERSTNQSRPLRDTEITTSV